MQFDRTVDQAQPLPSLREDRSTLPTFLLPLAWGHFQKCPRARSLKKGRGRALHPSTYWGQGEEGREKADPPLLQPCLPARNRPLLGTTPSLLLLPEKDALPSSVVPCPAPPSKPSTPGTAGPEDADCTSNSIDRYPRGSQLGSRWGRQSGPQGQRPLPPWAYPCPHPSGLHQPDFLVRGVPCLHLPGPGCSLEGDAWLGGRLSLGLLGQQEAP